MNKFNNSIFYHIYPLGMAGCPFKNEYGEPAFRLNKLIPWIDHIKNLGCNSIYIGPLFESAGHGYETTDYKKVDNRLGTNETFKNFVNECHKKEIKVIVDGVFNHTGRDFFAFKDLKENRENSKYKDWYLNVNFNGNNEYNDGFSYDNWGGYNLLVKLNLKNPDVKNYLYDVIKFWVNELDIDGIRLDAADVLDFDFMKGLRNLANEIKENFFLLGEVIHGEYKNWVNDEMLHSVTNYQLHKAFYSAHNDQNYFEIAHTVKRLNDMLGEKNLLLYNFLDNHDVDRIISRLSNKNNIIPIYILLYTLPGIPSIYYGSEFGIEGKKVIGEDKDYLVRPELDYNKYEDEIKNNKLIKLISLLGKIRNENKELFLGNYNELLLKNKQFVFSREYNNSEIIIAVNNDTSPCNIKFKYSTDVEYVGVLSGLNKKISSQNGELEIDLEGNSGEIFISRELKNSFNNDESVLSDIRFKTENNEHNNMFNNIKVEEINIPDKSLEDMNISELQQVILNNMSKNGPVTDEMKRTVYENVYKNSLINWAKSFR